MPEQPTLQELLLQKATSIGPDPIVSDKPIGDYPGALIGQMPFAGTPNKLSRMLKKLGGPLNKVVDDSSAMDHRLEMIHKWGPWLGNRVTPSIGALGEELVRSAKSNGLNQIYKLADEGYNYFTDSHLSSAPGDALQWLLSKVPVSPDAHRVK